MAESKYIGSGGSDSLKKLVELIKSRVVPISKGGTGATSAAAARDNLDAAPKSHTHASSNITDLKSWLLTNVFKVGYVWVSYTNTSPASIVGGTWTPITGRFPYFNNSTATGGSNTHTLSANEMPSHKHGFNGRSAAIASAGSTVFVVEYSPGSNHPDYVTNTGSGAAHNNMPAYQSLYAWRRTA